MERAPLSRHTASLFAEQPAARLALLRALWPRAVGAELAQRTRVEAVEGTTLRIRVPDVRWRRQLHKMQAQLVMSLRSLAGPLAPRRLGFVEGGISEPPAEPTQAPAPPLASLSAELRGQAEAIDDTEIRAAFLDSARRYLGRAQSEDSDA